MRQLAGFLNSNIVALCHFDPFSSVGGVENRHLLRGLRFCLEHVANLWAETKSRNSKVS